MTLAATPPPALPAAPDDSRLLPAGTRLDEFEIIRPLGSGGFGIVYLALDRSLLRQVALKEFMPAQLAARGADGTVGPRSPERAEQFERSLEAFFNEARLLAPFNHPALVRVHRFWKANGTAYMAMQYCPGQTLVDARRAMRAPPDEAWLRALLDPILDALERLHRAGVFHRDISPDNILLLPNGRPILLDFGSARRVTGPGTKSLTAVLKPNFAPVEQYAHASEMAQGPWTDLYALGATVHFLLTGEAPTPAVMRVLNDVRMPLAAAGGTAFPGVGAKFLAAIDWASALSPQDRPQSVEALRDALGERPAATATLADGPRAKWRRWRARSELALAASGVLGAAAWAVVTATSMFSDVAAPRARVAAAVSANASVPASVPLPRVAPTPAPAIAPVVAPAIALAATPAPLAAPTPRPTSAAVAELPVQMVEAPYTSAAVAAPARSTSASVAADASQARTPAAKHPVAHSPARQGASPTRGATAASSAPRSRRTQARDPEPRTPGEACAGRNFIARAICVSRQCRTAGFRLHPECVEARTIEEQRQRRLEN